VGADHDAAACGELTAKIHDLKILLGKVNALLERFVLGNQELMHKRVDPGDASGASSTRPISFVAKRHTGLNV